MTAATIKTVSAVVVAGAAAAAGLFVDHLSNDWFLAGFVACCVPLFFMFGFYTADLIRILEPK